MRNEKVNNNNNKKIGGNRRGGFKNQEPILS